MKPRGTRQVHCHYFKFQFYVVVLIPSRYFSHAGQRKFADREGPAQYEPEPDVDQSHGSHQGEGRAADQIREPQHELQPAGA